MRVRGVPRYRLEHRVHRHDRLPRIPPGGRGLPYRGRGKVSAVPICPLHGSPAPCYWCRLGAPDFRNELEQKWMSDIVFGRLWRESPIGKMEAMLREDEPKARPRERSEPEPDHQPQPKE
jgi:hypothetical protein